jgi:predicted amidohydrolase
MLQTIGGCQLPVTQDVAKNIIEIKKAIDWASENNIEIIGTPECALSGYMWEPSSETDPRVVQVVNGLTEIADYAKNKNVDVVLGTAFYNDNNKWANTQKFIVNGSVVHTHYKTIVFEPEYTPGDGVSILEYKGVKIAGLICNDFWANPMFWPDAGKLINKLKTERVQIVFLSANVPKEYSVGNCMSNWVNTCVEMYSVSGDWTTVVCDSSYLITGEPYSGKTMAQSGICGSRLQWVKAREHSTDYFKFTN